MDTKVRHMTLEQYKKDIVPLIVELKKILRKKYLIPAGYHSLKHLTKPQFIEKEVKEGVERSKKNGYSNLDADYHREYAEKKWEKSNLKSDEIPQDLYERYLEIYNTLKPLFINENKFELSKLHKDHKSEVRHAISDDVYINEIKNDQVDFNLLEKVCKSLGVILPKRVYDLKEKSEAGVYKRGFVKANEEFLKSIRESLTPYIDELKLIKKNHIMGVVEKYEKSDYNSIYDYVSSLSRKFDTPLYNQLVRFFDRKNQLQRIPDFDEKLEDICTKYANSYITSFVGRMEEKTNYVNLKWGIPTIEFSNTSFHGGEFETNFKLTYNNGEILTGDSKIIIAGGYIQVLHQRYLFHFWHNGKNVSLEQMDNLE